MPENNGFNFFKERKIFADRLAFATFSVPFLLVSLIIGTIVWSATIGSEMTVSWTWDVYILAWLDINMVVIMLSILLFSHPFSCLVGSSVYALANSIEDFENIPSFTESPRLNVLLLVYGYKIRRFVSGGVTSNLVIDDKIKHVHKKVEDILSEPAVIDVIKKGKSRHFKKDVVSSVARVIKGATQEVSEISKNAKIEKHNKAKKQNEESDHRVVEFLAREK